MDTGLSIPCEGELFLQQYLINEKKNHWDSDCVSTMDEDITNTSNYAKLPWAVYEIWRKRAIIVEIVEIVVTISLFIVLLLFSKYTGSSSLLAFSLDTLLATASSITLIWRFSANHDKNDVQRDAVNDKEIKACYIVGCAFALTGLIIVIEALVALAAGNHPEHALGMLIISGCSFIVLGALALIKFYIAFKLQSRAMKTDAVDSSAGALTAGSIILCTLVGKVVNAWFLDGVIAILIGIASIIYGSQTVYIAYKFNDLVKQIKQEVD